MSAPVIQTILDHLDSERDTAVDPSPYTVGDDWVTAFEYGGAR